MITIYCSSEFQQVNRRNVNLNAYTLQCRNIVTINGSVILWPLMRKWSVHRAYMRFIYVCAAFSMDIHDIKRVLWTKTKNFKSNYINEPRQRTKHSFILNVRNHDLVHAGSEIKLTVVIIRSLFECCGATCIRADFWIYHFFWPINVCPSRKVTGQNRQNGKFGLTVHFKSSEWKSDIFQKRAHALTIISSLWKKYHISGLHIYIK